MHPNTCGRTVDEVADSGLVASERAAKAHPSRRGMVVAVMAAAAAGASAAEAETDASEGKIHQLVDYDGAFLSDARCVVASPTFNKLGFEYSVVTVLGCQSSGKSTLLNAIFGTSFEVMDAAQGRNQTTKGLWLARAGSTVIVDVEGTDSKERGEDRLTFEHRAALFSLALADVVLINMWYSDLGRYTASNYGLLKTVLGVNLELFQADESAPRTTLLFVIRDYTAHATPLAKLGAMIHDDVRKIWEETTKPPHLRDSRADDFFDFAVISLAPKYAAPADWEAQISELKNSFDARFRPPGGYSREIPADGFYTYAESIWKTILESAALDIPSQKEMLATYRCEELKAVALGDVTPELRERRLAAEAGELSAADFGWAGALVARALGAYDAQACRYQRAIYAKKRAQLAEALQAELQKILDLHLQLARQKTAADAAAELSFAYSVSADGALVGGVPKMDAWAGFRGKTAALRQKYLEQFEKETAVFDVEYEALQEEEEGGRGVDAGGADAGGAGSAGAGSGAAGLAAAGSAGAGSGAAGSAGASAPCRLHFDRSHHAVSLAESLDALITRVRDRQSALFEAEAAAAVDQRLGSDLEALLAASELSREKFWRAVAARLGEVVAEVRPAYEAAFLGLQPEAAAAGGGAGEKAAISAGEEGAGAGGLAGGALRPPKGAPARAATVGATPWGAGDAAAGPAAAGLAAGGCAAWAAAADLIALTQLRAKLSHTAEWLHNHVVSRFQQFFDQDADQVPRNWLEVPPEQIRECYLAAREKALEIMPIFTERADGLEGAVGVRLPADAAAREKLLAPVIGETQEQRVLTRAQRAMRKACAEAQLLRSAGARGTSVPLWYWLALLAFGFNEATAVLMSPFFLILTLLLTAVLGLAYATGNVRLPLQLARQAAAAALNAATTILTSVQSGMAPQQPAAAAAPPPRTESARVKKEE